MDTALTVPQMLPEKGAHNVLARVTALGWADGPELPRYLRGLWGLGRTSELGAWALYYLAEEVAGVQSPHTLDAKARDLACFTRWYMGFNGHGRISDWAPRDTQAYLYALERDRRAPTTINRQLATLRRFARWVSEQPGGIFAGRGLPTRKIAAITVDEPGCKKLERTEVHALFKAADALVHLGIGTDGALRRRNARPRRNRALLALLYCTGLRVSELVVLQRRQLCGNHLVEVARKGRGRSRRVFLPAEWRKYVEEYLVQERPLDDADGLAQPLFLATSAERGNRDRFMRRENVAKVLKQIAAMASRGHDVPIALHPHRLRHTFGALHRDRSASDTETAAALGHTSLRYVGRYVRRTDDERDAILEEALL